VRRGERAAVPDGARVAVPPSAPGSTAPPIAVDPICGMTVAAVPGTPSVEYEGETIYFCCEGCRSKFLAQHEAA